MLYSSWTSETFKIYVDYILWTTLFASLLPLTFFDRSSQKTALCKASCSKQCSCSWNIGQQRIWNVTVTVENPLGKKTATDVFDVDHRRKGFFPYLFFWSFCGSFWAWYFCALVWSMEVLDFYLPSLISYLSLCYSYLLSLQFHLWEVVWTVENSFTPNIRFGNWNYPLMFWNLLLCWSWLME